MRSVALGTSFLGTAHPKYRGSLVTGTCECLKTSGFSRRTWPSENRCSIHFFRLSRCDLGNGNCRIRAYLLASLMYCSIAIVILGASFVGALMLSSSPASSTAFQVVEPNAAIRVLFCLKSGKFSNSDLIPEGLKNTNTSYSTSLKSLRSLQTVL